MTAIQLNRLTKYYGETRGIEDLSLAVEEGEMFGFLGPNGAGKTTTIRTLMGFQSPTEGGATVLGHDVCDERNLIEMKRTVGYLSSDPAFDEAVTGQRYLDYHAALKGDERSEELLSLFDPPMDRTIREYSRGNKQKLAIVLAFMHDPTLLIMDEPTSGLDPLLQERFLEFVRAEQERGKTFFFSSHILNEVQKVCDRVGIIRDGHLVEIEDVETLLHRGGKEVRVHVAEAVDTGDFAIEKFLSLLMSLFAINVVVGIITYAGATVITVEESLTLIDIAAVHALSIPYLLCCAAIGLGLSVLFARENTAQRAALGVIFGLFMLESLVTETDYEWIGAIAPTRYYDPTAILVDGTHNFAGAAILLGATVVLVVASQRWFRRKDIL
jgi:ABC-2 type transport system ATP-binding protein